MTRIIDPPRDQFGELPTPLTPGERQVIDLFDQKLPAEWEIYVQPHLNGLRPDIVLLHPGVGVAVLEVKDWDLGAYEARKDGLGRYVLVARDRKGREFQERRNPINKILLYKRELFDLYCPRLDGQAGLAVISAGLVFPRSPRREVKRVFRPFMQMHDGMRTHQIYYPISGGDDLASGNIDAIFPQSSRPSSTVMNAEMANDLRGWLREPFFSREQRRPLALDAKQRRLASQRTPTGYRRIKGPAGSGKSVALAARAANLAAEGKHVLVVSYNITLLNYLRDLTVRHETQRLVIRRQIDFLNFHHWCKRVCRECGHAEAYQLLWRSSSDSDGSRLDRRTVLEHDLPSLVRRIYSGSGWVPKYDAILVDEGQDFRPHWWQTLRAALKPGGEMMLVFDKTQNVYGTAAAWTEDEMEGAGFRGPWKQLKISYRLAPRVVSLVKRFAEEFLTGEEIDIPEVEPGIQMGLFPDELRWRQVDSEANGLDACDSELRHMMQRLRADTAVPDITFLSGQDVGRRFVEMQERKGVHLVHTFDEDDRSARRLKRAFFQGAAGIKATTIHSFKGWEARHLVVYVESVARAEDRAVLYTALTRLLRHEEGSCLTVVSCCEELRMYGRSWPDYEEEF